MCGHEAAHNPFSEVYQQLIALPVQCTRLPGHQEKASSRHFLKDNSHKEVRGLHMKGDTDDKRERQVLTNKFKNALRYLLNIAAFNSLWERYQKPKTCWGGHS